MTNPPTYGNMGGREEIRDTSMKSLGRSADVYRGNSYPEVGRTLARVRGSHSRDKTYALWKVLKARKARYRWLQKRDLKSRDPAIQKTLTRWASVNRILEEVHDLWLEKTQSGRPSMWG